MGNVDNYERRTSVQERNSRSGQTRPVRPAGAGQAQSRGVQTAYARQAQSRASQTAYAGQPQRRSVQATSPRQTPGRASQTAYVGQPQSRNTRTSGAGRSATAAGRPQPGRSRSSKSYGSAVPSRAQDRARRRRRKRRQQRMMFCLLLVLLALAVCGIFGVRRYLKDKARGELRDAGIASLDAGDYEAAIGKFDEALKDAGGKIGKFEADVLELRAEAEYRETDYAAALHTWELLLGKDAENQEYKEGAVLCLLETGDYERALSFGVLQSRVYNRMAVEQIGAGEYEKALETIASGMQAPEHSAAADLLYNQAATYEYLGDYGKALELFESYIAQYGSDEKAEREITFLKSRQGN